jgi:acid stress-induced BolA-like protein IbaG/YrbA
VTEERIKTLIEAGVPGARAIVGGDGTHFEACVVSPEFAGRSALQRHRMVYASLGDRMGTEIHALSLKTYTPEEWAATRAD